jgi:hypothetical protein
MTVGDFNTLSHTAHCRQQDVVAPMERDMLKVFFYDIRCAVVIVCGVQ